MSYNLLVPYCFLSKRRKQRKQNDRYLNLVKYYKFPFYIAELLQRYYTV